MKVFITRKIPSRGVELLKSKGYEVIVSPHDRVLTRGELIEMGKGADAVLSQLTDKIDAEVIDGWGGTVKIVANYAVGFDNLVLTDLAAKNVLATNTPVLTETVSEYAFGMILAIAHRIVEADRFAREGRYKGWEPELLLGDDIRGKTLGILGLGRIGSRTAYHGVRGFDMKVIYYDVRRNEQFEKEFGAVFYAEPDQVFKEADIVSVHVPLMESTRHFVDARRLGLMKPTAYLVNTSRGPVVDEEALRDALKERRIRGAAIDVWEHEPELTPGLAELDNIIITPHIASATEETRQKMSEVAAQNIIAALEGQSPPNLIQAQ